MIRKYKGFITESISPEEYEIELKKAREKFNKEEIINCLHNLSDITGCSVQISNDIHKLKDQEKHIVQVWVNVPNIYSKKEFYEEYFSKKYDEVRHSKIGPYEIVTNFDMMFDIVNAIEESKDRLESDGFEVFVTNFRAPERNGQYVLSIFLVK